ncbi:unnamed protein product [Dovyalis caffra]|uniref:Uncharacterized protein n=1 Tax=Dovyalis caffra TaxID=77055 RepID=A0AAV1RE52_9ROSI|nr:unnamed protein product [Dovyalis caffra]
MDEIHFVISSCIFVFETKVFSRKSHCGQVNAYSGALEKETEEMGHGAVIHDDEGHFLAALD